MAPEGRCATKRHMRRGPNPTTGDEPVVSQRGGRSTGWSTTPRARTAQERQARRAPPLLRRAVGESRRREQSAKTKADSKRGWLAMSAPASRSTSWLPKCPMPNSTLLHIRAHRAPNSACSALRRQQRYTSSSTNGALTHALNALHHRVCPHRRSKPGFPNTLQDANASKVPARGNGFKSRFFCMSAS